MRQQNDISNKLTMVFSQNVRTYFREEPRLALQNVYNGHLQFENPTIIPKHWLRRHLEVSPCTSCPPSNISTLLFVWSPTGRVCGCIWLHRWDLPSPLSPNSCCVGRVVCSDSSSSHNLSVQSDIFMTPAHSGTRRWWDSSPLLKLWLKKKKKREHGGEAKRVHKIIMTERNSGCMLSGAFEGAIPSSFWREATFSLIIIAYNYI